MFCSKICFEDSVQWSFPNMCFKDFVLWWDSRSGPPAFGSLWYVVEQYDGTTWNAICYYDAYMEAHRAMLRFEKSNIGDQIKEIYRASHVSGHIPAMPALLQPAMAHACAKRFRSMILFNDLPRLHLLAATICSNSVFKHFSCCHFDSNTSSNSRKKCTRLMDLSPSDIPLQKLENSIPRPNACL